jgi:hypothetical protein
MTTRCRQQQQQAVVTKPSGGVATATKRTTATPAKTDTLPRTPRTSAVTLTLCEGSKMTYAEVIAAARQNVPLGEIGDTSLGMRMAMTGAVIIKVPGDKTREEATQLANHLTRVLDPATVKVAAPTKRAERQVIGIDISMGKEELRQALASAAGCGIAEVQVGEIGKSRGGLGSAYVKCPVAGARKMAQAGRVALG